jgi:hypothetical protein
MRRLDRRSIPRINPDRSRSVDRRRAIAGSALGGRARSWVGNSDPQRGSKAARAATALRRRHLSEWPGGWICLAERHATLASERPRGLPAHAIAKLPHSRGRTRGVEPGRPAHDQGRDLREPPRPRLPARRSRPQPARNLLQAQWAGRRRRRRPDLDRSLGLTLARSVAAAGMRGRGTQRLLRCGVLGEGGTRGKPAVSPVKGAERAS